MCPQKGPGSPDNLESDEVVCGDKSNSYSNNIVRSDRAEKKEESRNCSKTGSMSPSEEPADAPPRSLSNSARRTSSSACNQTFFPSHPVLKKEIRDRVVKCAHKRLRKSLIQAEDADSNSAQISLPVLRHTDLSIGDLLGSGSFSSVYSIANEPDKVVKVLRKKLLRTPPMLAACAADLYKEGLLLRQCSGQHANIVQLLAWSAKGVDAFHNGRHDSFFLVLEKLNHTLSDKLREWRDFKEKNNGHSGLRRLLPPRGKRTLGLLKLECFQERLVVIDQLAQAIVFLHSKSILHRDLKPDNIGFSADGVLKVFDFDVARTLPSKIANIGNPHAVEHMTKRVGSPRYMSPECARGEPYNSKADVYTFALLVHELYSLEKPYDDIPSDLHDDMVFYEHVRPYLQSKWPPVFKQTLAQAWNKSISKRPTMQQLEIAWHSDVRPQILEHKIQLYTNSKRTNNRRGPKAVEEKHSRREVAKTSRETVSESYDTFISCVEPIVIKVPST